ncbi:hypothetical protein Dda_6399 [Drechslerella dactyloides]|uniref:Uncharacterized protein n=1 Tax=Drechslerella dactyloides TaxID=74499 RepID=A0AAD6ITH8_DREDA|nr:hypothetical protein Dda_6399 [Drechslerella dactyloides]
MQTITVSRGNVRSPTYVRENKEAFYGKYRQPLFGSDGHDPTTANLTDDLKNISKYTIHQLIQAAMESESKKTSGFLRCAWVWGIGYVLRDQFADERVIAPVGLAITEMISSCEQLEILRQQCLDIQEKADEKDDSALRSVARRSMIEYLDVRCLRRITGHGHEPVVKFPRDALSTLNFGGGWAGMVYECAVQVFPGLMPPYTPGNMTEHFAAMANTIASLPRDQLETTGHTLIPVYTSLDADWGPTSVTCAISSILQAGLNCRWQDIM